MRFRAEPKIDDVGPAQRTAILLCNLGTPDAPTPAAVRRYLAEFLSDRRVVEIPRLVWLAILHGIILRTRPAKSAAKYASIWKPEGSPLRIWTDKQAKLLGGYLGERGHRVTVRSAMRYGNPSIPKVLDELKAAGAMRILVLPLYPQYAGSTTASVHDADILETSVHMGGTVSGEHGVGIEKFSAMCVQFAPEEREQMMAIKRAFDPKELLNPGKVIPSLARCAEYGKMHVRRGLLPFADIPRF